MKRKSRIGIFFASLIGVLLLLVSNLAVLAVILIFTDLIAGTNSFPALVAFIADIVYNIRSSVS